jgi:N-acetylneuraminate synthase/N,N'-diacetyllegionaminate synthase
MSSTSALIQIGGRTIGADHPCFVIAEAGVNHNGDGGLALDLVEAAAAAGADAVKFQHFAPELLAREDAGLADYQAANIGMRKSQRDMLRELVLPIDALAAARERAAARGLVFLCTAFDRESARSIADLVPAWKVSSTDLTNHPFLADLCAFGKPLILSSGMATLAEVEEAVAFVRACLGRGAAAGVALLHCVSAYPAPVEQSNLAVLALLRDRLDAPVGYSDHTLGIGTSVGACALGAAIIEKHLTLDRALPGPDHKASLDPLDFARMVGAIREAQAAVGQAVKEPQPSEREHRVSVRRSLHAAHDLDRGHRLGLGDVLALRPADGIDPRELPNLIGRRLSRTVRKGAPLRDADFADG